MKKLPKCQNCKWAGHNRKKAIADDACCLPNNLPDRRNFKYTTNSKNTTHCDKHEFVKNNGQFHPCGCTDYNGEQCYNCLNGFHEGCNGNCKFKNSKHMGVKIIFNPK